MADLPPPVRVSPLIKFGRWSFLAVGILYGAAHQSRLSKREVKFREVEGQQKAARDLKIQAEKKRAADDEIRDLEMMAGLRK